MKNEMSPVFGSELCADKDLPNKYKFLQILQPTIKKVYPSITELSTINNSIKCTEDSCNEMFTSNSNLNFHLFKTHNRKDAIHSDSSIKQFHCPNIECIYHETQFFKNKKLLKQHYLKVHSPKTYLCGSCNQGFSSNVYKNMHMEYCGIMFKCNDCPYKYSSYESLMTHARRKQHEINIKSSFKQTENNDKRINESKSENNVNKIQKTKTILPKTSSCVQLIICLKNLNNKKDQSTQTHWILPKIKNKISPMKKKPLILRRISKKTEFVKKHFRTQASTQTNTDTNKSNTFLDVNEIDLPPLTSDVKQSSSSTQTSLNCPEDVLYSSKSNTNDSVSSELIGNFDTNFFNCNMETQTDLIFNEDIFNYCDYYSDMYTQTCEDMLLNNLEFNHIETQTVDDMLRSVESQTAMSGIKNQKWETSSSGES